jgi:hypothetical protein
MEQPIPQDVLEALDEVLTIKREGMTRYAEAARDAPDELKLKLTEYAEQARRGALAIETGMGKLGVDAATLPGAPETRRLLEQSAALAATTQPVKNRLFHLLSHEDRDLLVWELLDREGGEVGDILRTTAGAVASEAAWGAHGSDRNAERKEWLRDAIREVLAAEFHLADPQSPKGRSFGRR